ncbi:MAG: hypothetical protein DMF87_10310 [Acidobacteria bacterium]|nr:MAG: hypothetical protein DMF87_10310 [Acidobacteriota bacterium]
MPSSTVENYLKTIYLGTSGPGAEPRLLPMGQLASAVGVTPGTATTMVKTLAESGLVNYEPYAGVALTRAGRRLAALVLRRHRLVELFLVQVMGLRWDEVHDEAELLEHVVSDRLIDRMDEMLGRPEVDPHGDPIPDSEGLIKKQQTQTLQRDEASDSVRLRGKHNRRITIGARAASKLLVQAARIIVLVAAMASAARAQATRPFEIIDNSFLIEEAFNQDAGTVQTIGTLRMSARNDWESSLTQEWPLLGHTHQVSYSIPYAATTSARGVGDVMLNYRFQLMGDGNGTPAFSPRFSLILPTGNSARGLGEGGVGWQMNLPFSEQARDLYLHWNVGFTRVPSISRPYAGASAIWRAAPMLHPLVEALVEGTDRITLSPGMRVGWNRHDAQWVIGIAAPLTREDAVTTLSGLGYLSYEFGDWRAKSVNP